MSAYQGGLELLDRAVGYTTLALSDVTAACLDAPTPCRPWRLHDLLDHLTDSLDAFTEAAAGGVGLRSIPRQPGPSSTDPAATARRRALALLAVWRSTPGPGAVTIDGSRLDAPVLLAVAAVEITVHGWDVAQATERRTPVPDDLAAVLLPLAAAFVTPADRATRFAPQRDVGVNASPGARLLAFLGRDPAVVAALRPTG